MATLALTFPGGVAAVAAPFTVSLAATGGTPAYTFSIPTGILPPGLTLNASTGVISGTPTTAGTWGFSAEVTDSASNSASVSGSLTVVTARKAVANAATPGVPLRTRMFDGKGNLTRPWVSFFQGQGNSQGSSSSASGLTLSWSNGNGVVSTAFAAALVATGGDQPYTFSITGGSLPSWATLDPATGAVTGTPGAAGTDTFTAQVTDQTNATVSVSCTITITTASGGGTGTPGAITALAVSEPGPRLLQPDASTHTTVRVTPTISGGTGLQYLTVYLSHDGGANWYWYGVYPFRLGTDAYLDLDYLIYTIAECAGLASNNVQAYALDGQVPGGPIPMPAASLPGGGQYSNLLSVLLTPPSATGPTALLTNAQGAYATATNIFIGYNAAGAPWAQVTVTLTLPPTLDPNCWFYDLEMEWVNSSGVAGDPGGNAGPAGLREVDQLPNSGQTQTYILIFGYPDPASAFNQLQLMIRGVNRNVTVSPPFADTTGNTTLLACWPGASTFIWLQALVPAVVSVTAGDASALPTTDARYAARFPSTDGDRQTMVKVWYEPAIQGNAFPTTVAMFWNSGDGTGWHFDQCVTVTSAGQWFYKAGDAFAGASNETFQIAALPTGGYNANYSAGSTLPAGSATTSFTLTGIGLPAANLITSLMVSPGPSGDSPDFPYNVIDPSSGYQEAWIDQVSFDDTAATLDPNAFFTGLTIQCLDASGNPCGPVQTFDSRLVSGKVENLGPIKCGYGMTGGPDRTASPASIRLELWIGTRAAPVDSLWTDPAYHTQQMDIGGGLGYVDVLIATGGAVPGPGIPAGQIDPSTINAPLTQDPATGNLTLALTTPLSVVSQQLTVTDAAAAAMMLATQAAGNTILASQAVTATAMAQDAITYANQALAALAVVDNNMYSVALNKVTCGTSIFAGPVVLARGNGYPMVYMDYDSITLFSACTASGSAGSAGIAQPSYTAAGLTSWPYLVIKSAQLGLFSGGNLSATLTPSALTFWSTNGVTTQPYATFSAGGLIVYAGSFTSTFGPSSMQLVYAGGASATLLPTSFTLAYGTNSMSLYSTGLIFQSGAYVLNITNNGPSQFIQLWTSATVAGGVVTGNPAFPCLELSTAGVSMQCGSGSTFMSLSLSTTNGILLQSGTTGPSLALSSLAVTLTNGVNQAQLDASGFSVSQGTTYGGAAMQANTYWTGFFWNGGIGGAGSGALMSQPGTGMVLQMGPNYNPTAFSITVGVQAAIVMPWGSTISIYNQVVLRGRQTGPGTAPSGFADPIAQAWCSSLYNALAPAGHGLID